MTPHALPRRSLLTACVATAFWASAPAQAWSLFDGYEGSGRLITEQRAVAGFEAISVSGGMDVLVRQGAKEALELQIDDQLVTLIETRVVDGPKGRTLEIGFKRGTSIRSRSTKTRVTVDVLKLQSLDVRGGGVVRVEGLSSPRLDINVVGSGDLRLSQLQCGAIQIKATGSGDVRASGRTRSLQLSMTGSNDVDTRELQAEEVVLKMSGSGDAVVAASKSLDVKLLGSGSAKYLGDPAQLSLSSAGSGTIKKL